MSIFKKSPVLFPADAENFTSQGIGTLSDALTCKVTEERNGAYELEMTISISAAHFSEIELRSLILAKPNPLDDPQPFRVYAISRPIGGICTVRAEHWSYDLSGIPVAPFTSQNASAALTGFTTYAAIPQPFTFGTDMDASGTFTVDVPSSIRSVMGGVEGSIIDVFGGEWKYGYLGDPRKIWLMNSRGADNGVQIRYGKNLTDLRQEENIANVYTGVYPYWTDGENTVTLENQIINAEGSYAFQKILTLDLSANFEEQPTPEQLEAAAAAYMTSNAIGTPAVSLTVSFIQLGQTEEYKNLALLENVSLCDTVRVVFENLGVNATAKIVKTVYNVLTGRYDSVELGSARGSIAATIAGQNSEIKNLTNGVPNVYRTAIQNASNQISGNNGGYIRLYDSDPQDGEPDELLIMDTPDIETAVRLWRWNLAGLGYSNQGYDPAAFVTAITQDGAIVADFITAGQMSAARIQMESQAEGGLTDYVRIGMDENNKPTIEIGAAGNEIMNKLMNDRIAFIDTQGNIRAYFSNNSFAITQLQEFIMQTAKWVILDNGALGLMAVS